MKKFLAMMFLMFCLNFAVSADDLYRVTIGSHKDAQALISAGVEPIVSIEGGYVILANSAAWSKLRQSGLEYVHLATGVAEDELSLDGRLDRENAKRYEVLYEERGVRLLRAAPSKSLQPDGPSGLFPLLNENLRIEYHTPASSISWEVTPDELLDSLIGEVNQDSLSSYVSSLQAFLYRLSGTAANRAARDWIADKFRSFGYDSVVIDTFLTDGYLPSYNVVTYKTGTVYPRKQIIVDGHFDAVANSPGADDNASGTAATLEIARILKDVETAFSFVFIGFDAEEWGLDGARHYAGAAAERGDEIVFVQNFDMIAFERNSYLAALFYGHENAYALLWQELAAESPMNITGVLSGTSTRSDHAAFAAVGYDVLFTMEYTWSEQYHTVHDSTTYMDFEYMKRMVQASLATVFTVNQIPPPVEIIAHVDPGDGDSQILYWHPLNTDSIAYYRVYHYPTDLSAPLDSVDIPATDSSYHVYGLVDCQEYAFYVRAFDYSDRTALAYDEVLGVSRLHPLPPEGLVILPLLDAVDLTWDRNNSEFDFDHYALIRDGQLITETIDTFYVDSDPALGCDFHSYYVMAVDWDGYTSDTVDIQPFLARAATLVPDRILGINRSSKTSYYYVDEIETGEFLRDALHGYNFDYRSDTAATGRPVTDSSLHLNDMIDYGLVVVGAESGSGADDIGGDPAYGGLLDTLAYYMSIGGKVLLFGRWGSIYDFDTLDYPLLSGADTAVYEDWFHIDWRVETPTFRAADTFKCDLIAARSQTDDYPDLIWDSLLTAQHSAPCTTVVGIPFVTYPHLTTDEVEVLYTYDSREDHPLTEGQPVAWRYLGPDYQYIYFDVPLSFFDRSTAVEVVHQAVMDLAGIATSVAEEESGSLPSKFTLYQNYPNPFNPETQIIYSIPHSADVELVIYNLLGQRVRALVDERQTAGRRSVLWDGRSGSGDKVASGLYFYRLKADDLTQTKKMILLK